MKHYIGIDIGGTKCAVTLGRENASADEMLILEKNRFGTPGNTPGEVLDRIALIIGEFTQKMEIEGIGISCGGPLDSAAGIILSPPNLPSWDHIEIVRYFEQKFRIPVHLQNDANACAIAEWKYGAGKGLRNIVFLTFGTGMGAGLILDGRLYAGTNDMAGEVGHWRICDSGPEGYGKAGSFEGFCSGGGLALAARAKIGGAPDSKLFPFAGAPSQITAKRIADLADEGDEFCKNIYADCGRMLGKSLALMIDILNPQAVILGSIFARSRNLLWEYAKSEIQAEALAQSSAVCRVLPAQLGENLGDIAALTVATGKF